MRGRSHEDNAVALFLDACERGKPRKARRIYGRLDDARQREAKQLLVKQNMFHLEKAELAQDSADFCGRIVALLRVHGVGTAAELPPDIRTELSNAAEALDARE